MIELFILIQVLTPGSNVINFYEDRNWVEVRTSISHKSDMILNFKLNANREYLYQLGGG